MSFEEVGEEEEDNEVLSVVCGVEKKRKAKATAAERAMQVRRTREMKMMVAVVGL